VLLSRVAYNYDVTFNIESLYRLRELHFDAETAGN